MLWVRFAYIADKQRQCAGTGSNLQRILVHAEAHGCARCGAVRSEGWRRGSGAVFMGHGEIVRPAVGVEAVRCLRDFLVQSCRGR